GIKKKKKKNNNNFFKFPFGSSPPLFFFFKENSNQIQWFVQTKELLYRWPYLIRYEPLFPKHFVSIELNAEELAQQMTLMNFEVFRKVSPRELLNKSWEGRDGWNKSPHLRHMIDQFDTEVKWAQLTLIQAPKVSKRVQWLCKLMDIATHCERLGNFHTLVAMHTALKSCLVKKMSWTSLSRKQKTRFDEFQTYFDWKFSSLAQMQLRASAPAIPYIGFFCRDFYKHEEGGDYVQSDGSINRNRLIAVMTHADRLLCYKDVLY
ncbi:Ras guanine nucleotide exchange factor, partial [Reticulomyxa filosa]